jgi:hypothetical protein
MCLEFCIMKYTAINLLMTSFESSVFNARFYINIIVFIVSPECEKHFESSPFRN